MFYFFLFFFFFSSRRRHTRSLCDWSSDVCSSDLGCAAESGRASQGWRPQGRGARRVDRSSARIARDRKSTRLNSSHTVISYAVFCLKKKKKKKKNQKAQ